MSTLLSADRVCVTCEFIEAHSHEHGVRRMCQVLEVAPSAYAQAASLQSGQGIARPLGLG